MIKLTIPLIPPSGNHYKVPVWNKRRFYVTPEAKAFKQAISVYCRDQFINGDRLEATIRVFLGKGDRLDAGNVEKCVLDGLQDAAVIRNDSLIKRLVVEIERDWDNPRTEIEVRVMEDL